MLRHIPETLTAYYARMWNVIKTWFLVLNGLFVSVVLMAGMLASVSLSVVFLITTSAVLGSFYTFVLCYQIWYLQANFARESDAPSGASLRAGDGHKVGEK